MKEEKRRERLTSTGKRGFHFWSEKCIFGQGGGTLFVGGILTDKYNLIDMFDFLPAPGKERQPLP